MCMHTRHTQTHTETHIVYTYELNKFIMFRKRLVTYMRFQLFVINFGKYPLFKLNFAARLHSSLATGCCRRAMFMSRGANHNANANTKSCFGYCCSQHCAGPLYDILMSREENETCDVTSVKLI